MGIQFRKHQHASKYAATALSSHYVLALLGAVAFSSMVFALSLQSFQRTTSSGSLEVHDQQPIAKLVEGVVIPGHPVYVLYRVRDKAKLFLEQRPKEKIRLQLEYAHDRLVSAETLLERKEMSLAISTLSKAEMYLGEAADDLIRHHETGSVVDQALLREVMDVADLHIATMTTMREGLTDQDRDSIDRLLNYTKALRSSLSGYLRATFDRQQS
jgi:hypothetical protein